MNSAQSNSGRGGFPDPPSRPAFYVNRAARLIARVGEQRLRKLGLGVAYAPVLALLAGRQSLSQKRLAGLIGIEQPTMAQLLARMDKAGLIVRTADPTDRRSTLISLTPLARRRLPAARRILAAANSEMTAGFTPAELGTLRALLGRMIANLETAVADDGG